jgi:hypothetical protein
VLPACFGGDALLLDVNDHYRHCTIDLTKFVRSFTSKQLFEHLMDNRGCSLDILRRVVGEEGAWETMPRCVNRQMLETLGTALVHVLRVFPDFQDMDKYQYAGPPAGADSGKHAMVLQNWWATKQV